MEDYILKTVKNKSLKNFTSLKCHPKNKSRKKKGTCLDSKTLILLKNIWNKRHPDSKITTRKKENIWRDLKKYLSESCNNEMCWIDSILKNKKHKENIKDDLFVPLVPKSWKKNPTEWLSSVEISDVMKQYEDAHDDFVFLGPSPIDFDSVNTNVNFNNKNICVWPELCNFNLKKHISNNVNRIGMIFNLDKHYQGGSHWVSMFLDVPNKQLFYFDSAGGEPPKEIKTLSNNIQKQAKKLNIVLNIDNNKDIKHQTHNTECGMYCLYFIISILNKKHKSNYFKKHIIKDKLVKKFRSIYFNNI